MQLQTAEMPGFYSPGEYDVAGFAVGAVRRDAVVDGSRIAAGDALLGFASSGVHSNGFSLVRKILEARELLLPFMSCPSLPVLPQQCNAIAGARACYCSTAMRGGWYCAGACFGSMSTQRMPP
jgi:hypothetical protein